jgi:hypothetical protein
LLVKISPVVNSNGPKIQQQYFDDCPSFLTTVYCIGDFPLHLWGQGLPPAWPKCLLHSTGPGDGGVHRNLGLEPATGITEKGMWWHYLSV